MTKPTKWHVSQCIRPVWSKSSLCTQWVAKDPSFLHADSENSDNTRRMPRLIWVFAGGTFHFVGFVMHRLKCYFYCKNNQRKLLMMLCAPVYALCLFICSVYPYMLCAPVYALCTRICSVHPYMLFAHLLWASVYVLCTRICSVHPSS